MPSTCPVQPSLCKNRCSRAWGLGDVCRCKEKCGKGQGLRPPQRRSPRITSHTSALLFSLLFALSVLAQPCKSLPEVRGNFSCDHSDTLACAHTHVSLAPLLQSVYCDPRSQRLTLGESHDNLPPVALSPLQHHVVDANGLPAPPFLLNPQP